jgi:hypothetical protein
MGVGDRGVRDEMNDDFLAEHYLKNVRELLELAMQPKHEEHREFFMKCATDFMHAARGACGVADTLHSRRIPR